MHVPKIGKTGFAGVLVAAALLLSDSTASATHDLFQYKFPCVPADACYVTQLNHSGALDFDPQGSAGLGEIRAASEGIFRGYVTEVSYCNYPATRDRAGMYAEVEDMHGRTLIYAHLSEFGSLQAGQRVLQGDLIGIEGNTGNSVNCAPHLHLGGIATAPGIDGIPMAQITAGPTLYDSTNSFVGAMNLPGAAIRARYAALGSWEGVGWTADPTGGHEGCPPGSFCRLYVHYAPDPLEGHWGSVQFFRQHPTLLGGFEYGSIEAGRWAVSDAYRVGPAYFAARVFGAQTPQGERVALGLPLMDQIGPFPLLCEDPCVGYQRFHVGYIWSSWSEGNQAVFCPDVAPPYPNHDFTITTTDIVAVLGKYGLVDPSAPYEQWFDSWYDINGDGRIVMRDILLVVDAYGIDCYPD